MTAILAIDVGGTQLRVAAYPKDELQPIKIQRAPTKSGDGQVFERLAGLIQSNWPDVPVEAISVAIPGPVEPESGLIIETPNIPDWRNFPLGEKLAERFRVPIFVGNDANFAALGEWRYGTGQGHSDVLYLTISTGIGGGVISAGELLLGSRGLATELGHVTVLPDGPLCSCGQRGHLEAVSSGPGIVHYFCARLAEGQTSILSVKPEPTARDIAEAARAGDALAISAYQHAGEYLGQALADYLHIFNPSIIVLGGGVSQSGALILDPARKSMERHVMNPSYLDGLETAVARLGDDAGLLGALAQAHLKLSEKQSS